MYFSNSRIQILSLVLLLTFFPSLAIAQNSFQVKGNGNVIPSASLEPSMELLTDFPVLKMEEFSSVSAGYEIFNPSSVDLVFFSYPVVKITGPDAADFSVGVQPFKTINPGQRDFLSISFQPSTPGLKRATISFSAANNNFSTPYWFNIQAEATSVNPAFSEYTVSGNGTLITNDDASPFSEDFTDFGDVSFGGAVGLPYIIKNTGNTTLDFSSSASLQVLGSDSEDFDITFPVEPLVAPGETTFIYLTFSPSTAGLKRATFLLSPLAGTPFRFNVQGEGVGENFENEEEEEEEDNSSDTDGDGVSDLQEEKDGSDPSDPESFISRLEPEFCFDWNGFLGMSYNIAEFANLESYKVDVSSSLFDTQRRQRFNQVLGVLPGSQSDLLVHDMTGWSKDSLGSVCSKVTSPNRDVPNGAVQGRMLRYKPNGLGSFDFVLSNEFSNPVTGSQFAQFNNFHPSLDPAEFGHFVANWFSIRNFESSSQSGKIVIYSSTGAELKVVPITLPSKGWHDFGTHEIGANQVGVVEWRPDSQSAKFRTNISRYFYAGPFGTNEIAEAVALPGLQGTSKTLVTPVDTRGLTAVLEITNTSNAPSNVGILLNNKEGDNLLNSNISVAPKATSHIVLDGFLENDLGVAYVKTNSGGKIIVNSLQYIRNTTAGVKSVYGAPAKESLGAELLGTYNTFLNQECFLTLSNSKANAEKVKLTMTKFNGQTLLNNKEYTVPGRGLLEINACSFDTVNSYGTVKVETTRAGSIVANIVRIGADDNYRIATPLK